MADQKIKALNFKVDQVGKYMKGSKKRFQWVIGLGNKTHTIILDFSFISGKVKAYVDGRVLLQNQIPLNTSFQHPFTLDGYALNLIQQGQNCQLRINNKVFSHLYTQEKTMQQFRNDESEFGISMNKDFMNKINTGPNKITLDIGGQKKATGFRKNKVEEGDWGGFGGIGMPAGFEPPPGMAVGKGAGSFGAEFDAPSKPVVQQQQGEIDFFGDDEPAKPAVQQVAATTAASTDLMGGDLLSGGEAPKTNSPTQSSIETLYQQTNMMNTNQLLFNTNLQQQAYFQQQQKQQGVLNTGAQNSGLGGLDLTAGSTSLPYNTSANLGQMNMFATGTNPTSYATGVNMGAANFGLGGLTNLSAQPQSATGSLNLLGPAVATQPTNVNYQLNTGFQTGAMNLNQLYQTNQGVNVNMNPQQSIHDLTNLTTSTQQQVPQPMHQMGMFQTGLPNANTSVPSMGFNTTVPTNPTNNSANILDLM